MASASIALWNVYTTFCLLFGWLLVVPTISLLRMRWPRFAVQNPIIGVLITLIIIYLTLFYIVPLLWMIIPAIYFGVEAAPWLAFTIVLLSGGAVCAWRSNDIAIRGLAIPALALLGSLLPHLLFVIGFNEAVSEGIEPSRLSALANTYEHMAVWLHERVKPWLTTGLGVSVGLALLVWRLSVIRQSAAPLEWLKRWQTWSGRAALGIVGLSAFTVLTTLPAGAWSPNTGARLAAQLRLKSEFEAKAQSAKALRAAVEANPAPLTGLTVAAARALQGQLAGTCHPKAPTALIRITPTATGCELAEIPIGRKDEVAESASEEIARQVSEQLIPDVPSPQETHPSGSAQAALAEVRSAAGSAAKAREIAVAARDEAKSRISAALSKASDATFDAFGFGTDNELAEKVREKLLEPLIDRFAEAIVAKIGPGTEWRRGRLEATAAVRADRVAAAASADGALSTSELLETVIKAAQKAGADTVYAADRAERMRIERERRQVEEMARRSRGSHIR